MSGQGCLIQVTVARFLCMSGAQQRKQRSAEAPVAMTRSVDSGSQGAQHPVPRARSVMDLSRADLTLPPSSAFPRNKSVESFNSSEADTLPKPRPRTQAAPDETREGSTDSTVSTSPKKVPPTRCAPPGAAPSIPSRGPPVPGRGGPPPIPTARPVGVIPAPVPTPRRDAKNTVDTAFSQGSTAVEPAHRPASQYPAADKHSVLNGTVGKVAPRATAPPPIPPRQGLQH